MRQIQVMHSLGNMAGLFSIQKAGHTFANGAKAAMASTNIARKHERCGSIRPAFENIRTARLLANRVQVKSFDKFQDVILTRRVANSYFEPFWFRLAGLIANNL
jgi:hypothetical protein